MKTGSRIRFWALAIVLGGLSGCAEDPEGEAFPLRMRGHQDLVLTVPEDAADGGDGAVEAVPLFLVPESTVDLCLEVPVTVDTSAWRARLEIGGEPLGPPSPPVVRMGTTLCFEGALPPSLPVPDEMELCAHLEGGGGSETGLGRGGRLGCRPLQTGDGTAWGELQGRLGELLGRAAELAPRDLASGLGELAAEARGASLPLLAVRFELIAVHFLSLGEETRPEAVRRLRNLPSWLPRAEAASQRAAQGAYLEAQIALLDDRRADAWRALAVADGLYLQTADPTRFTVAMQRADLLSDAGAGHEAVAHLRERLADCDKAPCDAGLLAAARLQMARLVLADPFRTPADVEAALEELAGGPPPEPASRILAAMVKGALALELGRDAEPALNEARQLAADLSGDLSAGSPAAASEGWIRWLEGQGALLRGDGVGALSACRPLTGRGDRSLAPWAWGCVARAHRLVGDLPAADLAFEKALAYHEHSSGARFGLSLASGLGPRAEDAAGAARVAVERGQPGRAWELLARLDQSSAHEARRRQCRASAREPRAAARWQEMDEQIEGLLADLARLDLPMSLEREAEIEPVRRVLEERLLTLWRTWPGCDGAPEGLPDGAQLRAFAVDDEVILLGREGGRIRLVRRTPLGRANRSRLVHDVTAAIAEGTLDDGAWRRLLAPAAEALLPPDLGDLPPRLTYALHGSLQALPLAALPLPAFPLPPGTASESSRSASGPTAAASPRWLGDLTAVALQPAGARSRPIDPEAPPAPYVFVVDPLGDLPYGDRSADLYGKTFPEARILRRSAASREALAASLARADGLHVDAHAVYEPAFPELSSLELADGAVRFLELAELRPPSRFANLSGCRTGSWYATADSGRYGFGGLMARLGVPWTVATRAPLGDRLAEAYNGAFYLAMAGGAEPPEAHRRALAELSPRYPAVAWASLLLLHAPPAGESLMDAAEPEKMSSADSRWSEAP